MPAESLETLGALQSQLSEQELLIQKAVRRFVRERYLPRAGQLFEDEAFPRDLIGELAGLGVLGASIHSGSKMWITNAPLADMAVVWAKLDNSGCSAPTASCSNTLRSATCSIWSVYTYEGTHEIHTHVLGKALTGRSAF